MTNEDQTRPLQAQQTRTTSAARPPRDAGPQPDHDGHALGIAPAAPTKLELSPAQIAGSALAAVSSAFFASWAGTAGTLIGVAAGSVIATVGAATYTWWLRRTQEAVRRRAALVRQATLATNGLPRTVAVGPLRRRDDRGTDTTRTDLTRADLDPVAAGSGEDEEPLPGRWALPWKKVLLTSVAVMVLALAVITGFETVTGRTVSDFTSGKGGSGSTVGNVFDGGSSTKGTPAEKTTPTPTPTPTSSTGSSTGSTPSPAPTPTPTVPTPSDATTTSPADPGASSTPDSGTGSGTSSEGSAPSTALP